MNQTLLIGWDNVLIGNEYNLNKWHTFFTEHFLFSKKNAVLLNAKTEGLSALSMSAALLPVISTIGWLFYVNREK